MVMECKENEKQSIREGDKRMKQRIIRILSGVAGAVLLIGSFPARELLTTIACDAMRIAGFACIFVYSIMQIKSNKKNEKYE